MAEILFAPKAIEDLREIKEYITEDLCNEAAALRVVKKITDHIRRLEDFPEIGTPLSTVMDVEAPYRFLVCGNYTAFYKAEENSVVIVRILYGRRNYMQVLFGKPQDE